MVRINVKQSLMVLAVICSFCSLAVAQDGRYAITNAKIITVSGKVIPRGTVVIDNGKIIAVGKRVSVPRYTQRINGRGLEVYPGLIDGGSRLGLTEIGSVPATNDSTEMGEFKPHLMAASAVHPASEHIPVTRVNGITAALTMPSGGTIAGQAALIHLDGWTIDEMAIKKSAGMVLNFPSLRSGFQFDFTTFTRRRVPFSQAKKNYERKTQDLKKMLNDARHYAQAKAAITSDPKLGRFEPDLKLEALRPIIQGEMPLLVSARYEKDIKNAVEFAEKEHLRIILTGADEAWRLADFLAEKKIPVILGPVIAMPVREDDPYDSRFTAPAKLFRAGVKFGFSSQDSSNARGLPYQAGTAVAYGLPRAEALKALTLNTAEILGVADHLGSIEVGKTADLVVTDGDIMELSTRIKYLFVAGRRVSLKTKQTELAAKYMSRP